jgi:TRAP-type C4-dicarboxylate transport system substrate-binding protein
MKKLGYLISVVFFVAAIVFPFRGYSGEIKLTIASFIPEWAPINGVLKEWANELEGKSQGRVKTEIHCASAMGKPGEHFDLAVNGIADVALVGLVFSPGRFPMAEVAEYPIGGQGWKNEIASMAMLKLYSKGYFDNDFKGTRLCFFSNAGPFEIQMTKSPIRTFEDIKGKKIRGAGKTHTQIIQSLGGVSVGIAGGEVTIALQKGIIDGSFMPYAATYDWKCADIVKHITEVNIGTNSFAIVMNKDSYEKLPKDLQAWINDAREKYTQKAGKALYYTEEKGKQDFLKAGGKIYQFSDADMQKLSNAVAPLWVEWIEEGKSKGLPRKEMLKDLYNFLKGMGINPQFAGYTP